MASCSSFAVSRPLAQAAEDVHLRAWAGRVEDGCGVASAGPGKRRACWRRQGGPRATLELFYRVQKGRIGLTVRNVRTAEDENGAVRCRVAGRAERNSSVLEPRGGEGWGLRPQLLLLQATLDRRDAAAHDNSGELAQPAPPRERGFHHALQHPGRTQADLYEFEPERGLSRGKIRKDIDFCASTFHGACKPFFSMSGAARSSTCRMGSQ